MQPLTPAEAEIATCIKRSQKFNPSGLSAKEWIEQSDLTQEQIAQRFGGYSISTVSTLCQKLGVERNLYAQIDPSLATEGKLKRASGRFQRRQKLVADCLRLAREGNELGRLGLEVFGIRIL